MAELISFITKPPEYGSTNPTVRYSFYFYVVLSCASDSCAALYVICTFITCLFCIVILNRPSPTPLILTLNLILILSHIE